MNKLTIVNGKYYWQSKKEMLLLSFKVDDYLHHFVVGDSFGRRHKMKSVSVNFKPIFFLIIDSISCSSTLFESVNSYLSGNTPIQSIKHNFRTGRMKWLRRHNEYKAQRCELYMGCVHDANSSFCSPCLIVGSLGWGLFYKIHYEVT